MGNKFAINLKGLVGLFLFYKLVEIIFRYTGLDILDKKPALGLTLVASFMAGTSLLFFLLGSFPFRRNPDFKISFRLSVLSLVLAFLQFPIWVLVSGTFPPSNLNEIQATFFTILTLVSLIGPASAWLVNFCLVLAEANKQQRAAIARKKAERQ